MRDDGQRVSIREDIDTLLTYHLPRPNRRIWIVDTVLGSDTTGNGKINKPYQTIGKALTVASAWDTIIFYGATSENITISHIGLRLFGLRRQRSIIQGAAINSIITMNADDIELGYFLMWNPTYNGHGVQIVGSSHFWIHNLVVSNIRPNYDAIDKSSGGMETDGVIEQNILRNNGGSGIGFVNMRYLTIKDNYIIQSGSHGIVLNASCLYNTLENNKLFENVGTGIWIQGNNNYLTENKCMGNTVTDLQDDGTDNRWLNNRFSRTTIGTHTTVAAAEETVFTETCVQPNTRVKGYLRVNEMVAGDDFIFRIKKSYDDGTTWDIIDETNLTGAQIIDRYPFDVTLEDADEQVRVTIERQSGTDRSFYHKRIFKDS